MKRGNLRVLLGAAPGVGKTVQMLAEGERLRSEGRDVVIGIVETHGRALTAARAEGLEHVPLRTLEHRGVRLTEMDRSAVIARNPDVALVDELAHTNVPGSGAEKRWQDVAAILAVGIDVITTVNVQHIESLGDVVQRITGVEQTETVPDAFVRSADQIEVVDLAPQALRDRLTAGVVYPAERIDAALSNYFRLGNLTALRELALLWLADEVENALAAYRAQQGIQATWPTRERVVVALTGGPEGETLLRRGALISARSAGGELRAVHVVGQDGLRAADPALLASQRALVESLGGTFHSVVGDDVPRALVEFARSVHATQLVIGASRRGRFASLAGPGIGASVIRESGDIDVHMVQHAEAAGRSSRLPRLVRGAAGALGWKRQVLGFIVALIGGPLLSWLLLTFHSEASITSDVLAYQLLVVVVSLIGGIWPALFAAVLSGVTLDFLFVAPLYTVTIADPIHAVALGLYVVIAVLVSIIVDFAARRLRSAERSAAESELLATIAGSVLRGQSAVPALVSRTREALGATGVRLRGPDGAVLATDGEPVADRDPEEFPVGDTGAVLEVHGTDLDAGERRLLSAVTAQLAGAMEHAALERTAGEARANAAADDARSALLSAVSHDVRRPLAAAVAAVGGLRAAGDALAPADRTELLATAEESLDALSTLLTDLLDVSRVEAGALAIRPEPVDVAAVVLSATDELGVTPGEVTLALGSDVPPVLADPVLLQRVLVNLLSNAQRHTPAGTPVALTTSSLGPVVEVRVIDHGPGVPAERRDAMFAPFQRGGDQDNTSGLGLGLALSRGFMQGMAGALTAENTPGGGLTLVASLPVAPTTPRDTQARPKNPATREVSDSPSSPPSPSPPQPRETPKHVRKTPQRARSRTCLGVSRRRTHETSRGGR
ncbi:ATP-binding protein [Microbacterium gorillae]|uniref:ATP-binding protein n=1 Tax=Microbacterium gorillae TaxID=1231063 RepID=UPI000A6A1F5E|nr:ATP-binding protein [Microbacterium gorillae]